MTACRANSSGAGGSFAMAITQRHLTNSTALLALVAACAFATPGFAETLYKHIGPDGQVLYTDRPPPEGKTAKTLNFADLPATPLPESVLRYREALQKSMQNRLANAGKSGSGVQLFTAVWCGYCRKAKAYLAERGIAFGEHDIDTPEGQLAFAQAGKASGIPLLLVGEQRVQGFSVAAYDAALRALRPNARPR